MTEIDSFALDRGPLANRFVGVRSVCTAMILFVIAVAVLVALVVHFVLDGQPLSGNGWQILGRSAISILTLAAAIVVPLVSLAVGRSVARAGLAQLAAEPEGELGPEGETEAERIFAVFAKRTFAEFAIAEAVGVSCGVLYHVTVDPLVWFGSAIVAAFLIARFPTRMRVRHWLQNSEDELAQLRR